MVFEVIANLIRLATQIFDLTDEDDATDVLNTIAATIELGDSALPRLEALTKTLKAMVDAGREPTLAEWVELTSRSDNANEFLLKFLEGVED